MKSYHQKKRNHPHYCLNKVSPGWRRNDVPRPFPSVSVAVGPVSSTSSMGFPISVL